MKKTLFLLLTLVACLGVTAQDQEIAISKATASSTESGYDASKAIDGSLGTYWHSTWNTATQFPVTFTITLKEAAHVDYVRYIPRQDGNTNGNWDVVYVAYCPTTTGSNFTSVGSFSLYGTGAQSDIWLTENGVECGQIRFTIESGSGRFASAAEIEAYAVDNSRYEKFAQYFTDDVFSELKPEVSSSTGIEDAVLKALVDNMLADAKAYRKFRVGEYEPYLSTETLMDRLRVSSYYNNYENPTGVYLKAGESCLVVVSGISTQYPVGLTIKNWVTNENSSSYSLRNGLNQITASTEGNVFVNYYTDDFETAPNVKVHFINAPVQGYWDQATMTNEDWVELLKGRSSDDNTILITRSEHAQLAYPVSAWLKHCPANVDSTMTLYQQVQWAERDILGLEKYGRQVKNRQLFYATDYGFMAAGGEGSYCHVGSLGALMVPDAARFDFWGVGHEWGHNNQVTTGFKWSGCGETTNNIYASWAQIHFTGTPHSLRLEDEVTGVGEYSNMRGGRMQTYFEEGLRKGISWQLQDGPDYYGTIPATKNVLGQNANGGYLGTVSTTSRNYDHFVKLVPFWQLNLWGTLAGKCPDIIPMVIESIRSTKNYSASYPTNGKKQINWMKLACDSAKIDLLPFFEKAGMLRPINAYIEDYQPGWNIITEEMIADLKTYVKEKEYPAFTEEINYINAHNMHIYRDSLKLQTPEKKGVGCTYSGNKVKVLHSEVRNAVAFETYNAMGQLIRITMYGLGSDDAHSFTQVLYPKSGESLQDVAACVVAVGFDGTRVQIYEDTQGVEKILMSYLKECLTQAQDCVSKTDATGTKAGYLVPDSVVALGELVDKVKAVLEKKDTTEHSYAEWYEILSAATEKVLQNEEARVPMFPNNYYSIVASNDATLLMEYHEDGLKTALRDPEAFASQWKFVPATTEGTYYLQHRTTGNYISTANKDARAKANKTNVEDAIAFVLVPGGVGEFLIQRADNSAINLYSSKESRKTKQVIAGDLAANNSTGSALWALTLVDNLNTLPEVSNNSERITYFIQEVATGENLYQYLAGRNAGRLSKGLSTSMDDNNFLFYFCAGSENGKYTIYNCATELPVTADSKNYLMVNQSTEAPVEYTITAAEDGNGYIISDSEKYWSTSSYVMLSGTNPSAYKFQKISVTARVENITVGELENEFYFDLMGRRIENPTTGIYIHNGKKILVK